MQPCMQHGGEGRSALRRVLAAYALHNPGKSKIVEFMGFLFLL